MHLFDAHAHLQDPRLAPMLQRALTAAADAGLTHIVCCGTREADWPAVRELATAPSPLTIIPSFGLHPWFEPDRSRQWQQSLVAHLRHGGAVGEIGLDHALEQTDRDTQQAVFRFQYEQSIEACLPASIHCRRAFGPLLEILTRYGTHPAGFLIHSYSGPAELVPQIVALNGYLSFSGTITCSGRARVHTALRAVPEERLLLETDAPDMLPWDVLRDTGGDRLPPHRRPPNQPAYLRIILDSAAKIRACTASHLAARTHCNGCRLFRQEAPPRP